MLIFFRILQNVILFGGGAYLCYLPFIEKRRLSTRKTIYSFTALFCILLAGYLGMLHLVSDVAAHLWFFVMLLVLGIFYIWSIKENPYKTILVLLLTCCYGAFLSGCAILPANMVFGGGIRHEILYTIVYLFLGGGTYYPAYRFMTERILPVIEGVSSSDLRSVYYIPFFNIFLQAAFFTLYDTFGLMDNLTYFTVLVALDVSTYFVVMAILGLLNSTLETRRMKAEVLTAEKLLEIQKNQYASWVAQIEAVRRARHDLKHHITMVQAFLDKDDKEGLQKHIRDFRRTMPAAVPMMLCKNMDVNAILLHYYERARKEGVLLELHVDVAADIPINSQDLAVVFGNCLENAFEACARMEKAAEKIVTLMAKPMGKGLAIVMDNTFNGQSERVNDVYLSSKRENHAGVGMASVKLVAERYSGIVSFESEGNLFMTSIRLGAKKSDGGQLK